MNSITIWVTSVTIWVTIESQHATCSLPVAVCISKTRVLKLPKINYATKCKSKRVVKGARGVKGRVEGLPFPALGYVSVL